MNSPSLHEFIADNRDEIFLKCIEYLKKESPERSEEELAAEFHIIIDEIVRALEANDGLPTKSPLPGESPTALRHGGERQRRGYAIQKIALDFGSISNAVGELGASQGYCFSAGEYRVFNQCIDTAISTALEQFSRQASQQQEDETMQRVGFLAHELRNSLSSARTSFVVLKTGQLGINSRTGDVLDRSLGRLEDLISQTLLAVQLQAGMKPELKRMRVSELLRDVEDTAVLERGIRVVIDAENALEIDADERLLVSAVSNLLQNALKFTRSGGQVIVRGRIDEGAVVIEVEDECGGLPPGNHEELFTPYVQRGAEQRGSHRRGLGLGLAITREAVEAHGGAVSVRNLPGKGCVFAVKLRPPVPPQES